MKLVTSEVTGNPDQEMQHYYAKRRGISQQGFRLHSSRGGASIAADMNMKTLGDIGELAAIRRITQALPGGGDVVVGIGDDCAVVRPAGSSEDLVLTSDPVVEGVHFDAETPGADIGHKAIGRALSVLAAMGGAPRWALVNIGAPRTTPVDRLDAIYTGMRTVAAKHGLAIVGGDMTESTDLEIHVFAIGGVPRDEALLRSTAAPGECLFVTGALGGSRTGRHLRITPRLAEGAWLRHRATAAIDISDGLATDLRHLVAMSGTGCELDLDAIPVSPEVASLNDERLPHEHALYDGEDFELLFTIRPGERNRFLADWSVKFEVQCTEIGRMTDQSGEIRCLRGDGTTYPLTEAGYEHF